MAAIDILREEFISCDELANFFGVTKKRLLDKVSLDRTRHDFIPAYKASAGAYFFKVEDVRNYLLKQSTRQLEEK